MFIYLNCICFILLAPRICLYEQMMLQVDLVRHRARARLDREKNFIRVLMFYGFGIIL